MVPGILCHRESVRGVWTFLLMLGAIACSEPEDPDVRFGWGPWENGGRSVVLQRGRIFEHRGTPHRYSFVYADGQEQDPSVDALLRRGFQAGGATWAAIVGGLVRDRAPEFTGDLHLDPEGDALHVHSDSLDALVMVARLVAEAKEDPAVMELGISNAVGME